MRDSKSMELRIDWFFFLHATMSYFLQVQKIGHGNEVLSANVT